MFLHWILVWHKCATLRWQGAVLLLFVGHFRCHQIPTASTDCRCRFMQKTTLTQIDACRCFELLFTANICKGNTTKSCTYLKKYVYTGLSVQTVCIIWFFLQKYNWKYHLSVVFGTVIKCPKGTGSAWETLHHEKLYFWQSIYLQCMCQKTDVCLKSLIINLCLPGKK